MEQIIKEKECLSEPLKRNIKAENDPMIAHPELYPKGSINEAKRVLAPFHKLVCWQSDHSTPNVSA